MPLLRTIHSSTRTSVDWIKYFSSYPYKIKIKRHIITAKILLIYVQPNKLR